MRNAVSVAMDSSYHIANLNRALDIVAGLVNSYDQIDEHISNLRVLDAAQLLGGCYSDLTSLSGDGDLEEEIQVCCASLRAKCLDEITHWPSSDPEGFLGAELERHRLNTRFFEPSGDGFDVTNCNALVEGVLEDIKTNEGAVAEEAEQLLHNLKSEWFNRYEVLVKVVLYVAGRWLIFSEVCGEDVVHQILHVKDKEQGISYREFDDCIVLLNMSDTYLRFTTESAERYTRATVHVTKGYGDDEASSVDYVNDKMLRLQSQSSTVTRVVIEGFSNSSEMVDAMVQRIVQVQASLQRLVNASYGGDSGDGSFLTTKDASSESSKVDIRSFKTLSKIYLGVLIDNLICKLVDTAYICWEVERDDLQGLLQAFNEFCMTLRNTDVITVTTSSRFVAHFFTRILRTLEEHVLIFTRVYARSQSDDGILSAQTVCDSGVCRDASIRKVDKATIATLLNTLLGTEFENISLVEAFNKVDWTNKIELSSVSNHICSLGALLLILASRPAALVRHVVGNFGTDLVSQGVMATSIAKYSHTVDSMLTTYLIITQDAFKQFVLGVTRVLSKDEDAMDLAALKPSIIMFLLFLSNVHFMSCVTLMLPYFAQEMYRCVSSVVKHTYDDPDISDDTITLSQVLKNNFHTCGSHVNLLKVQDYLLTQFSALVQQVLQKLLSRLLNGLTEEVRGFGEEALQLCTLITSLCHSVLPKSLCSSTVALVVDLFFTTVPDLFLDYLDLLCYQPSDGILHTITVFVVDLESALFKCMMEVDKDKSDMVYLNKFCIFSGVLRHDFSYLDDPNPPYNHRDLGRLSKMCKWVQSRAVNMSA